MKKRAKRNARFYYALMPEGIIGDRLFTCSSAMRIIL